MTAIGNRNSAAAQAAARAAAARAAAAKAAAAKEAAAKAAAAKAAAAKAAAAKAAAAKAKASASSFEGVKAKGSTQVAQTPTKGSFFTSLKHAAKTAGDITKTGKAIGTAVQAFKGVADKAGEAATKAAHASGVGLMNQLKPLQGVANGVKGIRQGVNDIREGIKNGDGHQIAGGALTAGKGLVNTAKEGLNTAAMIESTRNARALNKSVTNALGATTKLEKGIAKAAANAAHLGKGALGQVDVMAQAAKSTGIAGKLGTTLKMGAANLLGKVPGGVTAGVVGKLNSSVIRAGEAALGGAKGAAAAMKTAETAGKTAATLAKGAGPLAKAAGRFAPGANVAIAALDVGIAVKTITDPKASIADKVTSGITALGSVAAATNIPVVSQVGAAVSIASTAVGAAIKNFDSIKAGAAKVGSAIADGAEKVGSAVADGAKKVGSAIADGAKKVFSGW
jgi:hypothetical protein